MRYGIIKDGICENIIESQPGYAESIGAVPLPDGYGIGDGYDMGEWTKAETPEPAQPSPKELRERAYESVTEKEDGSPLIEWDGESLTVDGAAELWLHYAAEGSEKADALRELIQAAKEYIRGLWPDDAGAEA
jgi:hypothetical protein